MARRGDSVAWFDGYPGFIPGFAVSIVVAFAMSGRLLRALGVSRPLAWALALSLGTIVSATLTPGAEAPIGHGGQCDLSRIIPSIPEFLSRVEDGLNVVLFVPLGLTIGLLSRSRRKAAIATTAFLLPFAVETIQLVVAPLHRACQSSDVTENLGGLLVGLVIGTLAGRIWAKLRVRRADDMQDDREAGSSAHLRGHDREP